MSVIKKTRALSSPSPCDQIPYKIFKKCHSLHPVLLDLFNSCWKEKYVPSSWKIAIVQLVEKAAAKDDPSNPSHFRPIALTSCLGKIFSSVIKNRWLEFMINNKYLSTKTQKAFIDNVPGCIEHHLKLLSSISDAKEVHRSLAICWIDLANAYGSVHHDLILFALNHYHAPSCFSDLISSTYSGLSAAVRSREWMSPSIPFKRGVFQGDPLSVVIFNTVINTLVDATLQHTSLGYSLSGIHPPSPINLLQYADDSSFLADGPASCQYLLLLLEKWLRWSQMEAKLPKCKSLAFKASSSKPYDPNLTLFGQKIPYIGNNTIYFLGIPISLHLPRKAPRQSIYSKVETMLIKIDKTLLSRQQKLNIFKIGVCPKITWDLTINNLPRSWLDNQLQPLATRYLKKWSGLAKSADVNRLFLPKSNGGLALPSLSTLYNKLAVSKAGQLLQSCDSTVRSLAISLKDKEEGARQQLKPFTYVSEIAENHPQLNKKKLVKTAKLLVTEDDSARRLAHSESLQQQGRILKETDGTAADLWANAILSLPSDQFKFAMNAAPDTLPHNSNLHLWKKRQSSSCPLCGQPQTLIHVLNNCSKALSLRRYNQRHDNILLHIYEFVGSHLEGYTICADLPGQVYSFPESIGNTDLRPDIICYKGRSITFIELTVPFESCFDDAKERKANKYSDLEKDWKSQGFSSSLITIEVGSRGFIHDPGFVKLRSLTKSSLKQIQALKRSCIKSAISDSYAIFKARNHVT